MKKPLRIFEVKEILKNLEARMSEMGCMSCEHTLCNLEAEHEDWDNELERLEKLNGGE